MFALYEPPVINGAHTQLGLNFFQKVHWSRSIWNILVLKNVLLVLNIGMKEIKFVEHKIILLVTGWHIWFKMTIITLKRGHHSFNAIFSLQKGWPYNRGTTVLETYLTICLLSFQGLKNDPEQRGVIPNSFEHIFQHISRSENQQYLIRASYLEIYMV